MAKRDRIFGVGDETDDDLGTAEDPNAGTGTNPGPDRPQPPPANSTPDDVAATGRKEGRFDEADRPGGRYKVGDREVDAEGKPIKD
jgi:hypothetical protein